ncbi:hypothetical protein E2C01_026934 [Portunus trituberculatus]|uniref:Uncharacterized protein n=1 Tax=Portunus trituberculatus TaxID=210409 RepID=A0A5B7EKB9_PORTR|nr:hypothetical protein [Portunus trituberculatus]
MYLILHPAYSLRPDCIELLNGRGATEGKVAEGRCEVDRMVKKAGWEERREGGIVRQDEHHLRNVTCLPASSPAHLLGPAFVLRPWSHTPFPSNRYLQ